MKESIHLRLDEIKAKDKEKRKREQYWKNLFQNIRPEIKVKN